jgi:uncharacterized membrane protein
LLIRSYLTLLHITACSAQKIATQKTPQLGGVFFVNVGVRSGVYHTHEFSVSRAAGVEFHHAVCFCKQCVVATNADVVTGVYTGATLTNEDVAGQYGFTAVLFYAKSFGL